MSRYVKELENGNTVAYGFDHVLGYFIDEYGPDDDNGEAVMLIDECSKLTNMSNGRMIELMKKYDLPRFHVDRVVMDLPII